MNHSKSIPDKRGGFARAWRVAGKVLLALVLLYLLLLIPDPQSPTPKGAGKESFQWQRDAFWSELEKQFQQMRGQDFLKTRDPELSRQLNPQLQSFPAWLAANARSIPLS